MTAPEEPTEIVVEVSTDDASSAIPLYSIELDVYGQNDTYDLSPGRWLDQDEAVELLYSLQRKLTRALVAVLRNEDVRV